MPPRWTVTPALAALALVACLGGESALTPPASRVDAATTPDADVASTALPDAPPTVGEDVVPAPVLAAQADPGPVGRVYYLNVPEAARAARLVGCDVFGDQAGTGLASALGLLGGLQPMLERKPDGRVPLALFVHADGWEAGQASTDVAGLRLALRRGEAGEGDAWLARADAAGDDLAPAWLDVPAAAFTADGWFETEPGYLAMSLPIFEGSAGGADAPELRVGLTAARMSGRLYVDGPGVGVERGVLSGYLTRADALSMITDIQTICLGDAPPFYCVALENVVDFDTQTPAEILDVALPILGGFDVTVADGHPWPCTGECDALAVCFELLAEGAAIDGLTEATPQEVP